MGKHVVHNAAIGLQQRRTYQHVKQYIAPRCKAIAKIHLRPAGYQATGGPCCPFEEVESITSIRKRFRDAGMSLGALSPRHTRP